MSIASSYVGCCVAAELCRHGYIVVGSVREEGEHKIRTILASA